MSRNIIFIRVRHSVKSTRIRLSWVVSLVFIHVEARYIIVKLAFVNGKLAVWLFDFFLYC